MQPDVLEAMIKSYMSTDQPNYSFGWQGGEPTLMGVDFFREVVALEQAYGRPGAMVSNGLQTNATLIDDEFASLLGQYQFLVGVSIDGPEEVHDTHRRNAANVGSHNEVMRGVDSLRRNNVEYNALVLVSSSNVAKPDLVYEYLVDSGIYYHQYIPCVEFDDEGKLMSFAITAEEWGSFLVGIFDAWKKSDTRRVSIRDFDAIVGHMATGQYSMCVQTGMCNGYFVVEHSGDVYPCDFFVEKPKKIGSVLTDSWQSLQDSKLYRKFGSQKSNWNDLCSKCPFLRYCSGDCTKQRFYGERDSSAVSWLCEGWKRFYDHALPTLENLAVDVLNERSRYPDRRFTKLPTPKIGWNDPCFCGSEKKYRLCHGRNQGKAG